MNLNYQTCIPVLYHKHSPLQYFLLGDYSALLLVFLFSWFTWMGKMCSCLLLSTDISMSAPTGFTSVSAVFLVVFSISQTFSLLFSPTDTSLHSLCQKLELFLAWTSSLKALCGLSVSLSSAFSFICLSTPQAFWAPCFFMTVSSGRISLSLGLWRIRGLHDFPWIGEGWGPSPGHKIPDEKSSECVWACSCLTDSPHCSQCMKAEHTLIWMSTGCANRFWGFGNRKIFVRAALVGFLATVGSF